MPSRRRRRTQMRLWAICGLALGPASLVFADPPSSDNYRLVFADEFNGTSLNAAKWAAASPSWTMPNSNSSATASDVSVGNGVLTLTANRPSSAVSFNSGSISSYNTYSFTGGYVEARILLPTTVGSWPAFWGLYTGWPPEADIMEYPLTTDGGGGAEGYGYNSNQYSTNYHYTNSSGDAAAGAGVVTTGSSLAGTWHTYGMDWIPGTSMTFYLDGTAVQSYTGSSVAQMQYMYMIFDYAVGGWPGAPSTTQWPAGHSDQMEVDWVRLWQSNPNSDATSNWNISGGGAFTTAGNWTEGVPAYGNETAYFGRVGTASTASITLGSWQLFGGITFDGLASGTLAGTTAYTLGTTSNQIQLASKTSSGGTVTIQATAASTANQAVNAAVELWSNTEVENNMTGGQTLSLNGNLSGAGNLNVDGVGTVIISGTGSYTGTTTIGSAQGPAIVLAEGNSALSNTTVVIGAAGNSTTARLELSGGYTLPNAITLSGRNTNSPGIENLSGNNTLTGAISANIGGGNYQIQSDAGVLTLSGAASGGVALQALASGSRTFTLQGAGNGLVSGKIQNGSGVVSVIQAGPGTWSLSAANTYTGSTTVSGGTLQLLGSAAPIASYSFSPATVSGTNVTNTGVGGSALNATFNISGGTGSVTTTGGPFAGTGALVLNGNGSYLNVNSGITSFANTSSWTISAWVKTTQAGFTILNKETAGSNWGNSNSTFYLGVQGQSGTASGGVPVAVRYAGGWLSGTTTPAVDNGTWQMVTYTDTGTTQTVYVDGVAETTTQGFGNGDIGNDIRFGIGGTGEADGNTVSSGSIGAINIYTSALSSAQIQNLYTSNSASIATTNILPSATPIALTSTSAVLDLEAVNQTIPSLTGPVGSAMILGTNSSLTIANTTSSEFDGSVTGNGSINEPNAGTFTLGGATIAYTGSTNIGSGAIFNLAANNTSTGILTRTIGAVTINANGKIALAPATSHTTRQLLVAPSFTDNGLLDLSNNDIIIQGVGPSGLTTIAAGIKKGFNNGNWQGTSGITSSSAASATNHLTALGVIQNDNGSGAPIYSTFDGTPVADADVLIKYTYYGDATLDGKVDGSDYSRIDNGYLKNLTGWSNGDFNYDGAINGSDYTLIDNAFNSQGAQLTTSLASPDAIATAELAGTSSVPEPSSLSIVALTALAMLGRFSRSFPRIHRSHL
jgi:autotransporter-associated beta strand protein